MNGDGDGDRDGDGDGDGVMVRPQRVVVGEGRVVNSKVEYHCRVVKKFLRLIFNAKSDKDKC